MGKLVIDPEEEAFVRDVLSTERRKVEKHLTRLFEQYPDEPLTRASSYTARAGGKRLRPILLITSYKALGGSKEFVYPLSLSVELIHVYSLIHDDLPQMDNDDYRRGKPTCHRVFGEKVALLSGVRLIGDAVSNVLRTGKRLRIDQGIIRRLSKELLEASGVHGLVGGQAADILHETRGFDQETLIFIHRHKTAILFSAAASMGAISSGADEESVRDMREYGLLLGFAFQVIDDILDAIGSFEDLGKRVGKDAGLGKATYPSLYGVEGSREKAKEFIQKSLDVLTHSGVKDEFLNMFPRWILNTAYAGVKNKWPYK